jgi:hypothetical protein
MSFKNLPQFPSESADDVVVFGVCADPEPEKSVRHSYRERTVMQTNPGRPDIIEFFEMQ